MACAQFLHDFFVRLFEAMPTIIWDSMNFILAFVANFSRIIYFFIVFLHSRFHRILNSKKNHWFLLIFLIVLEIRQIFAELEIHTLFHLNSEPWNFVNFLNFSYKILSISCISTQKSIWASNSSDFVLFTFGCQTITNLNDKNCQPKQKHWYHWTPSIYWTVMYFIDIFIMPNSKQHQKYNIYSSRNNRICSMTTYTQIYEEDNTAATTTTTPPPIIWLILWLDFVYVFSSPVYLFSLPVSVEHH